MVQLADLSRLDATAPFGDGPASRCHPGHEFPLPYDQHRGRDCADGRTLAASVRAEVHRSLESDSAAQGFYALDPRHSAQAGGVAVLKHPGLPATILALTKASDACCGEV